MLLACLLACSDYALDQTKDDPEVPEPDIEVSPSSLEWPTLGAGCVDEQDITVTNVGTGPLTLDGTYVAGSDALSAEFRTDTLAAGESLTFSVSFAPTEAGEVLGDIVVDSDDPDEAEVTVPTVGHVAAEGLASDGFVQEAAPIDVLWVIDNSSSMGQEQARVGEAVSAFFSWFTTLNLDYHMGVITTDIVNPIYSGRLVGSPTYIDGSTEDPSADLSAAIAVGEDDMGNESGLRAAELALSEPLLSAENVGFLRSDARLAVIFLSDEPEQSDYDSAHYISFFQTLKADPADILISAIVGDQDVGCANTCDGAPEDAQAGNKYLDVVNAFSGVFGSICSCELSPTLDEIGMETTRYIRSFLLSGVPSDPARIVVYVDSELSTDWAWVEASNEIVFGTPPINGSEIVVRYPVDVTCAE
jgi:hypothetical protein